MRNVVYVERVGGWKNDDAWCCQSESEAEGLAKFLRHLGVRNVKMISLEEHDKLPERNDEE